MNTVYIETSIVSYLRQRPSSQVVMAARQLLTSKWWETESVSRQSKGAIDRRFKRGQLDAEGMSDFAGGFSPKTLRECTRGKSSGYG
jgi:hypothetical protein